MQRVTVVGGGLAGLVSAVECAERGVPVVLVEARSHLGGRASTTSDPYRANLGPHALYTGPLWSWLRDRGLQQPSRIPKSPRLRFRWQGDLRATPPKALVRGFRMLRSDAPHDRSFREWVAGRLGSETAAALSGYGGPLTFDPDPGRVSARFLASRIRRILMRFPPPARYVVGGWGALAERLATHARNVGVEIRTGCRVERIEDLDPGPVVLAVEPRAARALLGDETLRVESPRVLLHDLGLERRRGDPYIVFDLDEAGFVDRFTAVDQTLAPEGTELVQASLGLRPGEGLDAGRARLERLFDVSLAGWRDRVVWDRQGLVTESTGALDLPGTTWEDRPSVEYRPGIWLAGDWVAVPGHLAEVAHASGLAAAESAVEAASRGVASR